MVVTHWFPAWSEAFSLGKNSCLVPWILSKSHDWEACTHRIGMNIVLPFCQMDILSNCLLNICVYTHSLVHVLALIKETSLYSGQQLMWTLKDWSRGTDNWLLSIQAYMGHPYHPKALGPSWKRRQRDVISEHWGGRLWNILLWACHGYGVHELQ